MKNAYFTSEYLSKSRWSSLWHQINEVVTLKPSTVLEIGSGSGLNAYVLKAFGIKVKTLDNDKKLKPDIVADICKMPVKDKAFDLVTCFQVLEHIDFRKVSTALSEILRVTRKYAVISVPEPYISFVEVRLKLIPFLPRFNFLKKVTLLPNRLKPLPVKGPHCWELGRKNYEKEKFERLIRNAGFSIMKSFYANENLYHRFYVLEKMK